MRKLKAVTVWNRRMNIERDKQREMDRLSGAMKDVQIEHLDKLQALRARCPHKNEMYYPDAAGGFGSFYRCTDCGQETKKSFKESSANAK